MSSGSNCCQNRTVLLFLCKVNEQPPDKQSGLSQAIRIRRHFIVIFYIIHVASVVLSVVDRMQFSSSCFIFYLGHSRGVKKRKTVLTEVTD